MLRVRVYSTVYSTYGNGSPRNNAKARETTQTEKLIIHLTVLVIKMTMYRLQAFVGEANRERVAVNGPQNLIKYKRK